MRNTEFLEDPISAPLRGETSLIVFSGGKIVFQSGGKWLHPLFELEKEIARNSLNPEFLSLHDKIAGGGAAALICRMGIKRCHIDLISKPAVELFEKHEVDFTYDTLVDRIQCKTEELVDISRDLDEIYEMLSKRAGLTS